MASSFLLFPFLSSYYFFFLWSFWALYPYFSFPRHVFLSFFIGGKTKCVKMNETLNQWKAL